MHICMYFVYHPRDKIQIISGTCILEVLERYDISHYRETLRSVLDK